jgi:Na+:H+ antiporter, NhaA family
MTVTLAERVASRLIGRVLRPFQRFAQAESSSGVLLLACAAAAVAWANSPWAAAYFRLWEWEATLGGAGFGLTLPLLHWINDGLMAVFFLVVGLEIKREMLVGELSTRRSAALPVAGAFGGMVVPALVFVALNAGGPGARGWGIPMATDIAFALGVATLLGPRVPPGLKIFLAALAIADDIGAVLVIAVFYTAELSLTALGAAALVLLALVALNRAHVRHPAPYALLGVGLWLALHVSGVHATIAGVLLAFTIPARTLIDEDEFLRRGRALLDEFARACGPETTVLASREQQETIEALEVACEDAQAPLLKMEHKLHGVVAFGIMPLFALANAGVSLAGAADALAPRVTLGVLLGLVLGKPVGITLAAWLAVRAGVAELPAGATWRTLHGVSWLGGIGFTMSLFVAGLAFGDGALLDSAKIGVLAASVTAGAAGWVMLRGAASSAGSAGNGAGGSVTPVAAGPSELGAFPAPAGTPAHSEDRNT